MDATTWLTISIVGYSLAGVLLIASVFMFYKMNIRSIVGDLTGRTEARQIQEIREQNKHNGNRPNRPNAFPLEKETKSAGFFTNRLRGRGKTGDLIENSTQMSESTELLKDDNTTILLHDETNILSNQTALAETEILSNDTKILHAETELLSDEYLNETTVLHVTKGFNIEVESEIPKVYFKILKDIKITHSSEVI